MNEARLSQKEKAMNKTTAAPTNEEPVQVIILQSRPTLAQWS